MGENVYKDTEKSTDNKSIEDKMFNVTKSDEDNGSFDSNFLTDCSESYSSHNTSGLSWSDVSKEFIRVTTADFFFFFFFFLIQFLVQHLSPPKATTDRKRQSLNRNYNYEKKGLDN